jgi:hypothetical protein
MSVLRMMISERRAGERVFADAPCRGGGENPASTSGWLRLADPDG